MITILNIETAVEGASVCLSNDEGIVAIKINPSQKDSAAWLHVAISELLKEKSINLKEINAVAVSAGPGSYTGLRVGMSAGKGLCFALGIPLITINTLQMMAAAAVDNAAGSLLCPMIDARRMEVFTALYNDLLEEIAPPTNIILSENTFEEALSKNTILFFGNGSDKFRNLTHHPNAKFLQTHFSAGNMASLSIKKFREKNFADLAYTEPFYGKEFYSTKLKKIL